MKLEKITERSRRYDDACGTAHGLELLGERWTLLIVRELMLGPRRFSDLRRDLPGLSANVLTQRLETLEANGVVRRRTLPPPASVQVYELTDWGYEAEPVIQTLGRWAVRSPGHDPNQPISAVSIMLSFRTMFAPGVRPGFDAAIGYRTGEQRFRIAVAPDRLTVRRVETLDDTDVVFIGSPEALGAAAYGPGLGAMEAQGALRIEGSREIAERFLALFELPPKAMVPSAFRSNGVI
ncbi:winged helix-turn-helix transcriptional regulator [Pseudochelatococcus lubricantis]|uniref:winged helix-turn-helix transcriptional regulator n=1 Tax=Pseudochelatococcus lubricantis TaxID=1538102 RepID=UPI0035EF9627